MKRVLTCAFAMLFTWCCFTATDADSQNVSRQFKGPDALIIYSSGTPSGTITDLAPDAVTLPTPVSENMKTLSDKLVAALAAKGVTARAVPALDVRNKLDILTARVVVIGSPSYFGNVSWQVKKLIDEVYGVLYRMRDKAKRPPHAAFSMAEIEPSAKETLAEIGKATKIGPTMIVLVTNIQDEVTHRVNAFADSIAEFIK